MYHEVMYLVLSLDAGLPLIFLYGEQYALLAWARVAECACDIWCQPINSVRYVQAACEYQKSVWIREDEQIY